VTLEVRFNCSGEATKSSANNYNLYACLGETGDMQSHAVLLRAQEMFRMCSWRVGGVRK